MLPSGPPRSSIYIPQTAARASTLSGALSTAQELEQLDQQITLTLQSIDRNFARAHHVISSSILPVVEQYAAACASVRDGSSFWKGFFEESAGVGVNVGVEEEEGEEVEEDGQESGDDTVMEVDDRQLATPSGNIESIEDIVEETSTDTDGDVEIEDDTSLASPPQPTIPLDSLGLPHLSDSSARDHPDDDELIMTSSPLMDTPHGPTDDNRKPGLSSRVLHQIEVPNRQPGTIKKARTYHVMATPLRDRAKSGVEANSRPISRDLEFDEDEDLKPLTPPRLHVHLLDSVPSRSKSTGRDTFDDDDLGPTPDPPITRTPGLSVMATPAWMKKHPKSKSQSTLQSGTIHLFDDLFNSPTTTTSQPTVHPTLDHGSPPRTMHFHIPHSRLLQTPAREASRRMVQDVLLTAGAKAAADPVVAHRVGLRADEVNLFASIGDFTASDRRDDRTNTSAGASSGGLFSPRGPSGSATRLNLPAGLDMDLDLDLDLDLDVQEPTIRGRGR